MVKKIKFPLQMKDGYKVRTMEELRVHSDPESLIGYFLDGKLKNWLKDRYYQEEIDKIDKLKSSDDNLLQNLYDILNINKKNNDMKKSEMDDVLRKHNILSKVKQYTDNKEVLENIDSIATSQNELENILKKNVSTIYLLGNKFVLPQGVENVHIKGINNVEIEVNSEEVVDFEKIGVYFENCYFDSTYELIVEQKRQEEENSHKKKKSEYKVSNVFDYLLSDSDRKKSAKIFNEIQNGLLDFEFDVDIYGKDIRNELEKNCLEGLFDIDKFGEKIRKTLEESDLYEVGYVFFDRIR